MKKIIEFISKIINNKKRLYGIIVVIAVLVIGVILFFGKGTVNIVFDQASLTTGTYATLSNDKYNKQYTIPTTIKLRRGSYDIYAVGSDTNMFHQSFKVTFGGTTTVTVLLVANSTDAPLDTNIDTTNINSPDYLKLFPHYDSYYSITATENVVSNQLVATEISINIFDLSQSGDSPATLRSEYNNSANQAKAWLASNKVPNTIPITVIYP